MGLCEVLMKSQGTFIEQRSEPSQFGESGRNSDGEAQITATFLASKRH